MRVSPALVALTVTGCCISAQIATPSRSLNQLPTHEGRTQRAYLEELVTAHDANEVVFPRNPIMRAIGAGLATLGSQANELQQTAVDQRPDPARVAGTPTLSPSVLASAVGREPRFHRMWVPVRVRGDLSSAAVDPSTVECPIKKAPTAEEMLSGTAVFCVYTQVAVHAVGPGKPPAPMILVIPGLLHSGDHQYVRTAAGELFALGFSVALVDVRDHGGTFHGQPWLPSTLGLLEGLDVLGVARAIAAVPIATNTRIARFGALGFSAGGLFALRAAAQDETQLLSAGILAVSPLLDLPDTLARMDGVRGCFLLHLSCINRRAMSFYFMDLLKVRMAALGLAAGDKPVTKIVPADYIDGRIRTFPGYDGLPDPRTTMTAAHLAEDLRERLGEVDRLAVAIYSSHDDPVVGDVGALTVAEAVEGLGSIGVFMPRRGGHIALSVVSPAASRAFVAGFFSPLAT